MAVVLALIWTGDASDQALMVVKTLIVTSLGVIFLVIWLFAFSRLSAGIRTRIAVTICLLAIAGFSTLKFDGITGNFVPILSWRLSAPASTSDPLSLPPGESGDFPQFLGPNRNATLPGPDLLSWETHPPGEVWRIKVHPGWSAFSVSGRTAITQEQREELECVVAYDLLTGTQLWIHSDETYHTTIMGGQGPRATPTITGDWVYALGATGILNCLDIQTGQVIWARNLTDEHSTSAPRFGFSGSPLVHEDKVILSAGGRQNRSLVAHSVVDGRFIWGGGKMRAGYSSPSIHRIAGRDQILILNNGSVAAHHPENGEVFWEVPWPTGGGLQCVAQPLPIADSQVFVTTGYGIGCKLYEISETNGTMQSTIVYETPRMKAKFTQVVLHDGYIYGLDDGVFVCLDPETGQRKWKRGRYGHGQILLVGDKLIVQTEDGDVVLVRPNPDGLEELGTIPALSSKTWNNPVLAGSLLLVRNDREAVCYEVALKSDDAL